VEFNGKMFSKKFPGSKMELWFVDTFRFINTSLDSHIKNLTAFPIMEKVFTDLSTRSLLLRKGIYIRTIL
ncbi:hypothetical protein, partial [Klebsiella pneumoniae]|uniref:hypothetical protein n=1 Tax=Klebsiella pneumoniae TaxID=573 RepID=UPI004055812D